MPSSRILLQQPANQVCSERPSGSGKEAHTEPNADQVEGNRHGHVDLLQQLLLRGWGHYQQEVQYRSNWATL
jgi:hypothetical protein